MRGVGGKDVLRVDTVIAEELTLPELAVGAFHRR